MVGPGTSVGVNNSSVQGSLVPLGIPTVHVGLLRSAVAVIDPTQANNRDLDKPPLPRVEAGAAMGAAATRNPGGGRCLDCRLAFPARGT